MSSQGGDLNSNWRLRAANGWIIAESGESYHNRDDCLAAIALVKGSGQAPTKDE